MSLKFAVALTADERTALQQLLAYGKVAARSLTHARILLQADEGEGGPAWPNAAICQALGISENTVTRVRRRFLEVGLEAAVHRYVQPRRKKLKPDSDHEARLIPLTGREAPESRDRWNSRLLAGKRVPRGHMDQLSPETVRTEASLP